MAYDFSRLEILLVDDDVRLRGLAVTLLGSLGVDNVRQADTVAEAFQSLCSNPCDLVLCAWEMAPEPGIELARLVRQDDKSPNPFLPVVIYTPNTDRYRLMTVRDAGVNEFVETPFSAESLYLAMAAVVENPRPFVRAKSYFGPDRRQSDERFDDHGPRLEHAVPVRRRADLAPAKPEVA